MIPCRQHKLQQQQQSILVHHMQEQKRSKSTQWKRQHKSVRKYKNQRSFGRTVLIQKANMTLFELWELELLVFYHHDGYGRTGGVNAFSDILKALCPAGRGSRFI